MRKLHHSLQILRKKLLDLLFLDICEDTIIAGVIWIHNYTLLNFIPAQGLKLKRVFTYSDSQENGESTSNHCCDAAVHNNPHSGIQGKHHHRGKKPPHLEFGILGGGVFYKFGEFLLPGQYISLVVKSGIFSQKLESKNFWSIFMPHVNAQVDTSFWCNFSHFLGIFSHFLCVFCTFYGQAEIKQAPNPTIKIRQFAFCGLEKFGKTTVCFENHQKFLLKYNILNIFGQKASVTLHMGLCEV